MNVELYLNSSIKSGIETVKQAPLVLSHFLSTNFLDKTFESRLKNQVSPAVAAKISLRILIKTIRVGLYVLAAVATYYYTMPTLALLVSLFVIHYKWKYSFQNHVIQSHVQKEKAHLNTQVKHIFEFLPELAAQVYSKLPNKDLLSLSLTTKENYRAVSREWRFIAHRLIVRACEQMTIDGFTKWAHAEAAHEDLENSKKVMELAITTARRLGNEEQKEYAVSEVIQKAIDIWEMLTVRGDTEGANWFYDFAKNTAFGSDGNQKYHIYKIAELQAKQGDIDGAHITLNRIAGAGPHRSYALKVLTEIAKAQVRKGNVDDAIATAAQIEDPYYIMKALNEIAELLASPKDIDHLSDVLRRANQAFAQDIPPVHKGEGYCFIANIEFLLGQIENAKQNLRKASERDPGGEEKVRAFYFSSICQKQIELGFLDDAQVTAKLIPVDDLFFFKDFAISKLVEVFAKKGDMTRSLAFVSNIKSFYRKIVFRTILKVQAKTGHMEDAEKTFQMSRGFFRHFKKYDYQDAKTLASHAKILADHNNIDGAISKLRSIPSDYESQGLKKIAKIQVTKDDYLGAKSTLQHVHNIYERVLALIELAEILEKNNKLDLAKETLLDAVFTANFVNPAAEVDALTALVIRGTPFFKNALVLK